MLVVIPARMGSVRLPGKPLVDIGGEPLVVRVWRRAVAAEVGPVLVATDDERVVDAVEAAGGRAVMTDDCRSGSDRVWQAVCMTGATDDRILNVQGDMPFIEPDDIVAAGLMLEHGEISTLVAEDHRPPVRAIVVPSGVGSTVARALYFSRTAESPYGHLGIYGFQRHALEAFAGFATGIYEMLEGLEQLRALENGIPIVAGLVGPPVVPSIDTPEDLAVARKNAVPA